MKLQELIQNPEELGPNAQAILNFWAFVEQLTDEQKEIIRQNHDGRWSRYNKEINLESLARTVSRDVTWAKVVNAFGRYDDDLAFATAWATMELISMHILVEKGYNFHYLKKFEAVQQLAQGPHP